MTLGSGHASSANDGVVEVAGTVDGGLTVGAVVEGGVKRELVEVGGDKGAGLASTFLTAPAAAGVGKPLRLLTGATAEDVVVEARTFQMLTAGGLGGAASLGAGAGDGLTSSTFASSAGFSTAVSLA